MLPQKFLKNALKGVLAYPMPWAILLGALVSVLGWTPPKPVAQTVGLLADAASPVALFTLFWHPLLVLLVGGTLISQGVPCRASP